MAKADDPPFKNKLDKLIKLDDKPDAPGIPTGGMETHDRWLISDSDLPAIREGALREKGKRGGKASGEKRRKEPSPNPIIEFIEKKIRRDWDISSADMGDALKVEAQTGNADGRITMLDDGTAFVVMDNGKVKNRLATTSVPATVSRLSLTRTGSD